MVKIASNFIFEMPAFIKNKKHLTIKTCAYCQNPSAISNYCRTNCFLFPDGYLPFCNDCLSSILEKNAGNWAMIDKLCQYLDIPFIPKEWDNIFRTEGYKGFPMYVNLFNGGEYANDINWTEYFQYYKSLIGENRIEMELPLLDEKRRAQLTKKWGREYKDEDFDYLERLLNGLLNTQNINGDLQQDQAEKLCKISLEIDKRIQAGADFDKILSSYDKLVRIAEFTPKNAKNINDLDSVGELFKWLEKRGYKCSFYNDVPKDVVDETIMNIQSWNQRLYTNESGIGDEISRRIEALKTASEIENHYDLSTGNADDIDSYDAAGFNELMSEDEEFNVEVE